MPIIILPWNAAATPGAAGWEAHVVRRVDIGVVGAGPAGGAGADCPARAGGGVALVDGSHPREKPCGGGVTGRALRLVAPALAGARVPAVTITTARFPTTRARVPLPLRPHSPP